MADVRPLPRDRARMVVPPPRAAPVRVATRVPASAEPLAALARAGDGFAFAAAGVDRRVLRELETGGRRPEVTLDLHGRKSHAAREALDAFVRGAQSGNRRVLLVIHGRGLGSGEAGPVLRNLVHQQLVHGALSAGVLAVVAAPARLGGSGASLVLLRR